MRSPDSVILMYTLGALPNAGEHLLFVFRLPGSEEQRAVRLRGLQPDRSYRIEGFEGERFTPLSGRALMEDGLIFASPPEKGLALLRIY